MNECDYGCNCYSLSHKANYDLLLKFVKSLSIVEVINDASYVAAKIEIMQKASELLKEIGELND